MDHSPQPVSIDAFRNRNDSDSPSDDKHGVIKEIGRLRLQLYLVQSEDNSEERTEFLRHEITQLQNQLNRRVS